LYNVQHKGIFFNSAYNAYYVGALFIYSLICVSSIVTDNQRIALLLTLGLSLIIQAEEHVVDALRHIIKLVINRRDNLDAAATVSCKVFCIK
jgi:hypothetical protein